MVVKAVTSHAEFKQILSSGKPAIFDFWATWCGPCKMISPVFEKLSAFAENEGVEFYKVDVDEQPEITEEVGVRAMPTFLAFKGDVKIGDVVGANPPQLQALVKQTKSHA